MKEKTACPYCKEDVNADAILCKHCHSSLGGDPRALLMSSVHGRMKETLQQVNPELLPQLPPQNASAGTILCYFKFGDNQVALKECLDNVRATAMVAALADKLQTRKAFALPFTT